MAHERLKPPARTENPTLPTRPAPWPRRTCPSSASCPCASRNPATSLCSLLRLVLCALVASRSSRRRLVSGTAPRRRTPLAEQDPHAEPPAKPLLLLMPFGSSCICRFPGKSWVRTPHCFSAQEGGPWCRHLKRPTCPGRAARSPQPEASAFLFLVIEGSWHMSLQDCFYLSVNPHFVVVCSLGKCASLKAAAHG